MGTSDCILRIKNSQIDINTKHEGRISLKTGAIICISGKPHGKWTAEDEIRFRNLFNEFDYIQITIPQISAFLLHGMWLKLLAKGITELEIINAKFGKGGKLEILSKSCKLPIIGLN